MNIFTNQGKYELRLEKKKKLKTWLYLQKMFILYFYEFFDFITQTAYKYNSLLLNSKMIKEEYSFKEHVICQVLLFFFLLRWQSSARELTVFLEIVAFYSMGH